MLDSPFRTAAGWAFFAAVLMFALVPGSALDRLYSALATFGAVGLLVLTVVALASLWERVQDAIDGGDDDNEYMMELRVIDGSQVLRRDIPLDEFQVRRLFEALQSQEGAYRETKRGPDAAFNRHEAEQTLNVLAEMGLVQRENPRVKGSKWILTKRGALFAHHLLKTTPPPVKDSLIVRI